MLSFLIGDENMQTDKRMAGDYEIIHAIHVGDKEVVFGVDEKADSNRKYLCGYYTTNELFGHFEENMASGDYLGIMELSREYA